MTSTREQWFNSADVLNLEVPEQGDLGYAADLSKAPSAGFNSNPGDQNAMDAELGNFFSSNYEDIDDFLTQELKDLDIPMVPQKFAAGTDSQAFLNYDAVWTRDEGTTGTPRKDHKRGPSGTAIFGFSNHNKQLSISKAGSETLLQGNPSSSQLLNYSAANTHKHYDAQNGNLNSLILKQQEELRLALERQQHMNEQLEEQLRHSQLQQKQLQMALQEQAIATHQLSGGISPAKTPSSRASHNTERNIIITSNSSNGGYKFPPPQTASSSKNGVISPISGTSVSGSPGRKAHKLRMPLVSLNGTHTDSSEEYSSPENFLGSLNGRINTNGVQKVNHCFKRSGDRGAPAALNFKDKFSSNNPITPQQQVRAGRGSSASSSPRINHHKAKESISSSASTIPQVLEDDDAQSSGAPDEGVIGLGIKFAGAKPKPKYTLNKPPPLDLLPTIPGSMDNTPMNSKLISTGDPSALPQKHVFQHTPTKNTFNNPHNSRTTLESAPNIFGTLKEELKPPDFYHSDDDFDEPESEFNHAKTPSPILKSQSRFEGSSPIIEHAHSSPVKITRKPTTLPPGEIDKYVKELPDKTFECLHPDCGKNFRRRYNIRSHIQTHLEDRPYICDFPDCNKAFVRNHDLIRHKKTHAEKCYICPCGKKFVREDALLVHRSRMICVGAKKFSNVVIKKSPRRRGRPRKDGTFSVNNSPVKESVNRDTNGTIALQMEEQLRKELIENGLLDPSYSMPDMNSPIEEPL